MKRLAALALALSSFAATQPVAAEESTLDFLPPIVKESSATASEQRPAPVPSTKARRTDPVVAALFGSPDAPLGFGSVTGAWNLASPGVVVRGQNPNAGSGPYVESMQPTTSVQAPTTLMPPIMNPITPGTTQDGGVWPGNPLGMPGQPVPGQLPDQQLFGANGAQPFRFGWQSKFDVGYIGPESTTNPAGAQRGDFSQFEFNLELRHTMPLPNQWIMSLAPQYGLRSWSGPTGVGIVPLPGDAHSIGLDVGFTSPSQGPFTLELGVTPRLATDFERSIGSSAYQFDGRGALYYRASPQWMAVLGAVFWDRVDDQVLPWAGLVFTPDDRWEIRAIFPNPQVSIFMGNALGAPAWFYVAGEYHIEAYDIGTTTGTLRDQVEFRDWRVLAGIRTEHMGVSTFIEGGYVFSRKMEFRNSAADLDIGDSYIVRAGMRF